MPAITPRPARTYLLLALTVPIGTFLLAALCLWPLGVACLVSYFGVHWPLRYYDGDVVLLSAFAISLAPGLYFITKIPASLTARVFLVIAYVLVMLILLFAVFLVLFLFAGIVPFYGGQPE